MATPGKAVLKASGKRGLKASGKAGVFTASGTCGECCGSAPYVIASFVTNAQYPVWDLRPYQGAGTAPGGTYWRLIEMGTCYPISHPWYASGCVDGSGRLAGLPNEFRSPYAYNGYLQLQDGFLTPGGEIEWPGTCQRITPRYPC